MYHIGRLFERAAWRVHGSAIGMIAGDSRGYRARRPAVCFAMKCVNSVFFASPEVTGSAYSRNLP